MKKTLLGLLLLTSVSAFAAAEIDVLPILHVVSWNSMDNAYPELEAKCVQQGGVLISKFADESARHSHYSYLGVVGACKVGKKKNGVYIPLTSVTNYTDSVSAPKYLQKKCNDLGGEIASETIKALMGGDLNDPYISTALCKL